MREIIGRKIGMTQVYANNGKMYPVTVVEVLPNVVTQVKNLEKDGYVALQVGYEEQKESRLNKPERGIYLKANVTPKMHLKELQGDEMKYEVGDIIKVGQLFKSGDIVDVLGTSKGKGFTGNIKQWHYHIGPKGHGSGYHRGVGSMAVNGLGVNRVMPGKKMPGHRGNQSVTVLNLLVVDVIEEKNAILIQGAIPGPKLSLVKIRSAVKAQLGNPQMVEELVDHTNQPVVEGTITPEVNNEEVVGEVVLEPAADAVSEVEEAIEEVSAEVETEAVAPEVQETAPAVEEAPVVADKKEEE